MKKLLFLFLSTMLTLPVLAQVSTTITVKAPPPVFPDDITVAQDGSADAKKFIFGTIQEAVNSVRDFGKPVTIHIKKGVYHEKLVVPAWKTQITLIGEDKENTIITNNDFSGKPNPGGKDKFGKEKFTTYTSYTVLVQGDDFTAENLTIENTAGRVGQAVALDVEADRCRFINCRLLGNQDTLYTSNENSRQYYKNCYIEGTVDFIFGEATCVFQSCVIKNLTNGSYATAASTTVRQKFGFVLFDCKLIADSTVKSAFLGRPWRSYAKTVYIRSELGAHVNPAGWNPWKGDALFPDKEKTAYYAEYKSTGPGANPAARVAWSHQLTDKEVAAYTLKNILGGRDDWNPLKP